MPNTTAVQLRRCPACNQSEVIESVACRHCGSIVEFDVVSSTALGVCIAKTQSHLDRENPLRLCLVRLDEGPLILTVDQSNRIVFGDRVSVKLSDASIPLAFSD